MYKNRIRRTTNSLDLQSFIRLCDIEFDKRARYVEFICNVWNESRFGPDLADPVILADWTARPEPMTAEFYNLDDTVQNGSNYAHPAISPPSALNSSLGRSSSQAAEAAFRRAKQMGLLGTNAIMGNIPANTAPKPGRGSPRLLKHQRCVVVQPAAPPQEM